MVDAVSAIMHSCLTGGRGCDPVVVLPEFAEVEEVPGLLLA